MRTALEALEYTTGLCLAPVGLMFLGSVMVSCKSPPTVFVRMTQHFGAGIVLSAVSTELMPYITDTPEDQPLRYAVSILIGFFLGVFLMVMVERYCSNHDEEGKEEDEEAEEEKAERRALFTKKDVANQGQGYTSLNGAKDLMSNAAVFTPPRPNKGRDSLSPLPSASPQTVTPPRFRGSLMEGYRRFVGEEGLGFTIQPPAYTTGDVPSSSRSPKKRNISPTRAFVPINAGPQEVTGLLAAPEAVVMKTPWALIVAVYVDSFMDGLLIGISAVAGANAGIIMTIALSIEMMFLGLTFAASLLKQPRCFRLPVVMGAPLMILVGGTVGSVAASALMDDPVLQAGLISFGMAALLYLVTEELLIEAHEGSEGHIWYVDLCFFVGFIASVLLEKAVGN